jgi:hypothetical protein
MKQKIDGGYDLEQHHKYASLSSGSPISLELQLYITLRFLSGALFLDTVWYGVAINTIHSLFWKTICQIDRLLDNIKLPLACEHNKFALLVNQWAKKRIHRHGFPANYRPLLAIDGFVIEIIKPSGTSLE